MSTNVFAGDLDGDIGITLLVEEFSDVNGIVHGDLPSEVRLRVVMWISDCQSCLYLGSWGDAVSDAGGEVR